MPRKNGLQAARELTQHDPLTSIILASGNAFIESEARVAQGFFCKHQLKIFRVNSELKLSFKSEIAVMFFAPIQFRAKNLNSDNGRH